jgi:hypothetical protein
MSNHLTYLGDPSLWSSGSNPFTSNIKARPFFQRAGFNGWGGECRTAPLTGEVPPVYPFKPIGVSPYGPQVRIPSPQIFKPSLPCGKRRLKWLGKIKAIRTLCISPPPNLLEFFELLKVTPHLIKQSNQHSQRSKEMITNLPDPIAQTGGN